MNTNIYPFPTSGSRLFRVTAPGTGPSSPPWLLAWVASSPPPARVTSGGENTNDKNVFKSINGVVNLKDSPS